MTSLSANIAQLNAKISITNTALLSAKMTLATSVKMASLSIEIAKFGANMTTLRTKMVPLNAKILTSAEMTS